MKRVLMILAALVLILMLICGALIAFAPTSFAVEREITIDKPINEVFEYVKLIKNQNEWGPWMKKDPKTRITYEGTDGTVGFVSKWDSEHPEVGAGEQKIVKIVDGERIDVELKFLRPFESKSLGYTVLESAGGNKTKVRWGFKGEMPRPMNVFLLLMDFDKEAGAEFDEGLASLKEILEKIE
ncbi:MAG: SRPBCC family protein [Acidobacteriota bacterium]|nr:SRPBCC family protein [Acidobacteriota bacterium]